VQNSKHKPENPNKGDNYHNSKLDGKCELKVYINKKKWEIKDRSPTTTTQRKVWICTFANHKKSKNPRWEFKVK